MTQYLAIWTLISMLLVGCASQDESIENETEQSSMEESMEQQPGEEDNTPTPIVEESSTAASQVRDETLTAQELLEEPDSPLASRIIYFAYDSAKVDDASMALLEAHGNFIATNGNVNVRLEGHADERGSREYNIALGDRRAQSVRRILLFQGASSDQIDTISYGEERPIMLGHDESSWSQNRRVELVYEVK